MSGDFAKSWWGFTYLSIVYYIPGKKNHYKFFCNYVHEDHSEEIRKDEAELHILKEGNDYKIYNIKINLLKRVPTIEIKWGMWARGSNSEIANGVELSLKRASLKMKSREVPQQISQTSFPICSFFMFSIYSLLHTYQKNQNIQNLKKITSFQKSFPYWNLYRYIYCSYLLY